MIQYRKILEYYFNGISQRTIETSVGSSRHTIRSVIQEAESRGIEELTEEMTDYWLENYLFPSKKPSSKGYLEEDWFYVHKELLKKNMTLRLLHREYEQKAKLAHKIPYAYRTYCTHYGNYAHKYKLTMPIKRKPGEITEIDWAGSKLQLRQRETGETLDVYIFVATLTHSKLMYVEGFLDMKSSSWIRGHLNAFEYFGGITETLVPDNLKTGVIKAHYSEPVLNEAYREMADYYRAVIVPARAVKPKDKSSVEGNVGYVSRQIIAALRNHQCFQLTELNQLIWEKLERLNNEDFQAKSGSRRSVFEEEERASLIPLRYPRFKLTDWRVAKVQSNYHIQVERNYYSVPYEFVQHQVDVRLSEDLIEVYFKQMRISSHKRIHDKIGQYSTLLDHMPDQHRLYANHTPENIRSWANKVGPSTNVFVDYVLENQVEKQALRTLMSFKNLVKKHTNDLIETSCEILLSITNQPSLATFKTILKRQNEKENVSKKLDTKQEIVSENHGFTRGADYFGGKR